MIGHVGDTYVPGTSNPGTILERPGGVARNIARLLAGFGADPVLVTAIGDDANGASLRAAIAEADINLREVPSGPYPTARYLAFHDERGELIAAIADMQIVEHLDAEAVMAALGPADRPGLLIVDCGLSPALLACIADGKGERLLAVETVSTPKVGRMAGILGAVDLIFTNVAESSSLLGKRFADAAIAAEALMAAGIGRAVVSDGSRDLAMGEGGTVRRYAIPTRTVVDVTGAGDALVAGVASGLVAGAPLEDAVLTGIAAASLAVETAGAGPSLTRDDLDRRRTELATMPKT